MMIKIIDAPAELADASVVGHKFARQQQLRDAGVCVARDGGGPALDPSEKLRGQPSPMWVAPFLASAPVPRN